MKRKTMIFAGVLLSVIVLAAWAVPAFADSTSTGQASTQGVPQVNKTRVLVRLLMVQDEAKVNAFLTKAESSGKLTSEQAAKIRNLWVNHHAQFAPGKPLVGLLSIRNGDNLHTLLTRLVKAGKLQPAQAARISALWTQLHNK